MADKMRFVVLGTGNIAKKYVSAFAGIESGKLVGAVGTSEEKARSFAQENGIEHWANNLKALLNKTDFEAVIIATPSGLHGDNTIEAANLKKHVLCEKPLDITLEKIDLMTQACQKADVKLGCAFQHRTFEHNRLAKEAITSGRLGRIFIANAFLKNFRSQQYYDSAGWRGTWGLDGGGPFIQQASHTIDLMVWILGPAKEVFARTATVAHNIEVEDMGHAIVRYENQEQGVIEASTVVKPGYPSRIEFHGEKGSIILTEEGILDWCVEGMDSPNIIAASAASGSKDPMAIGTAGHQMIIRDFIDAVRQNREPLASAPSARLCVELIAAIYQSAKTGKPVKLR
jgi:UDP-N-acetyl-2-amino-2-deoxyglucuronate dehydrogenase